MQEFREQILGLHEPVPLLDGSQRPYVNLDNAASTPPLLDVVEAVNEFLPFYASVHRGTGFKSRLSTEAYDRAHDIIAKFVGADPATNTVIFGKNTTEAINKLAYRIPFSDGAVVLTTQMEHHSNDLPWRHVAEVVHAPVTEDGWLDVEAFLELIHSYADRLALVTVTGASNVTGYVQPIHQLARAAHDVGAPIFVDAAQLAPHRRIDVRPQDHPEHIDFLALSGHKMYAPFGTGALIGPRETFLKDAPEYRGGGTVDVVTLEEVDWAGLPGREEAGSPNVVGAVAMAAAAETLMDVGLERIATHERSLLEYALSRLQEVPGLKLYGKPDPTGERDKVGVVPFNLEGISHFLVAAILGYEAGVAVRSGCFCAHPYVVHLLHLDVIESKGWRERIRRGDRTEMPGMVRMSLGCYNNKADVDRLAEALHRIAAGDYRGDYQVDRETGEYSPHGYRDGLEDYFSLGETELNSARL